MLCIGSRKLLLVSKEHHSGRSPCRCLFILGASSKALLFKSLAGAEPSVLCLGKLLRKPSAINTRRLRGLRIRGVEVRIGQLFVKPSNLCLQGAHLSFQLFDLALVRGQRLALFCRRTALVETSRF